MPLAGLDMNLVVVLHALLSERNVTRAGQRVGLSQPATSAALARLRRHFGDELLARKGGGYELTALGSVLRDRAEVACGLLELVFGSQPRFDPEREDREFVLLASDYAVAVFGAALAREISSQAPHARIVFRQPSTAHIDDPTAHLANVDGLLMPHGIVTGLPAVELFTDRWVCVVAEDNPEVDDSITLSQLATLPWVAYQHANASSVIRQMSMLGIEPHVQVVADSFHLLPSLVEGTRRVAMMHGLLAARLGLGPGSGVRLLPCPFDAVPVREALWWHPVHTHDAGHVWLREVAAEVGAATCAQPGRDGLSTPWIGRILLFDFPGRRVTPHSGAQRTPSAPAVNQDSGNHMPAVSNVLVAGAGLAGTAAATRLAAAGVTVDLIDVKPAVTALGSGITLQRNALRELRTLGVLDQVMQHGYGFSSLGLRAPDPAGTLLAELPDRGEDDLPATVGISRPVLARIVLDRAAQAGATVRLGTSYSGLRQDGDGVEVTFADGSTGRYDLVVAADGVRSPTRRMLGIDAEPRPNGMGIWRAFGPRPASVTRTDLIYGGPAYIAGFCPTGPDTLYAYIVEDAQDRSGLSPREALATMLGIAAAYHGPWDDIRPGLTDPSLVNYTWFETHVVPAPWNRGRIVLIGDAAHSCPPTLAQGGAQALEDAGVLAELLLGAAAVDDDLWAAFHRRRFDRVKTVIDASNQLAQWLLNHEQGDVPGLSARIAALVSQPA